MKEKERGLQKINIKEMLPAGFDKLPKDKQEKILEKIAEDDVELIKEAKQKVIKSQTAEHDLAVVADTVDAFDHERKYYKIKQDLETGSGNINLNVRGGDTKFITPVLIIIAIVVLGIVAILASR
jgi:hypothetical protein